MEKIFSLSSNLLISTELIPTPAPAPEKWWYYGLDHGQHIGFFRVRTLEWMASRFDKKLITDGRSYHLFSDKRLSMNRWRISRKLVHRFPKLFTRGLRSKVWSDFEKMTDTGSSS
jgi:hypothetical protein